MYRGNFTFPFILCKSEVQINVARSNILTVTNITWDLMLYTLVSSTYMSFSFYQTIKCYIPEDDKLHRLLLDLLHDFHTICTEMPHIFINDISQYYDFSNYYHL